MSIDMTQFYQVFFEEAAGHLGQMASRLAALDIDAPDADDIDAIFRAAHSIKGSSGTFGFTDMADVAQVTEALLDKVRAGQTPLTADMVDACLCAGDVLGNLLAAHRGEVEADVDAAKQVAARLAALGDDAGSAPPAAAPDEAAEASFGLFSPVPADEGDPPCGEGTIAVSIERLEHMVDLVGELATTQSRLRQSAGEIDPAACERLMAALDQLERDTHALQASAMSIGRVPMSVLFARLARVVREQSHRLDRQVTLHVGGEHTELDRALAERIVEPLTHLVRHRLARGIGAAEHRQAGKAAIATLSLDASRRADGIVIELADDGTDADLGADLDGVQESIAGLGGTIDVQPVAGVGTRIRVRLPPGRVEGVLVAVGEETYVLPLGVIVESLPAETAAIRNVSGLGQVIQLRGEFVPVIRLRRIFACAPAQTDPRRALMIVVEADDIRAALYVDGVLGQHQGAVKPLAANFRPVEGIAGATVLDDGRVAMIVDVAGVIAMARKPA